MSEETPFKPFLLPPGRRPFAGHQLSYPSVILSLFRVLLAPGHACTRTSASAAPGRQDCGRISPSSGPLKRSLQFGYWMGTAEYPQALPGVCAGLSSGCEQPSVRSRWIRKTAQGHADVFAHLQQSGALEKRALAEVLLLPVPWPSPMQQPK